MPTRRALFGALVVFSVFGLAYAYAAQPSNWDGTLDAAHACFLKGLGCPDKIDWQRFGFSSVVAQLIIQPDEPAEVALGGTQLDIPEGAFGAHPVRFTLLVGRPSFFQPYAPAGQRVIGTPFANDIVDIITGRRVMKSQKPILAHLTEPSISTQSIFWNTSATIPVQVEKNVLPSNIAGHTLSHTYTGVVVGWFVTSPQ